MSISMIGIDHSMAPVDIRALFAFTRKNAGEAMEKIKGTAGNRWLYYSVYMQSPGGMGKCG